MARKPFVVIDAEILNSSIWTESASTRLVWFTMLILCDTEGYVGAAVPGLARQAGVTVEECEQALSILLAPDPHSRTADFGGRRIEIAERGWKILNFVAALERLSSERRRARDRMRQYRARKKRQRADGDVTVPARNSEQGTGITNERTTDPAPAPPDAPSQALAVVSADQWNHEAADDFQAAYGAGVAPPKAYFAAVKAVARKHGWSKTRPALQAYMSETPIEFLNVAKCLESKVVAGPYRAAPQSAAVRRRNESLRAAVEGGLKGDGTI